MFRIIQKIFVGLLISIVNAPNHTKFGSYVWNPATWIIQRVCVMKL